MTREQHEASGMVQFEPKTTQVCQKPVSSKKVESSQNPKPIRISPERLANNIWIFAINKASSYAGLLGIYRAGLLKLINQMGYYKRYRTDNTFQYIHETDNVIMAVEVSQIRDAVTNFVHKSKVINQDLEGITIKASIEQQNELFLRNSPSLFNDAVLGHLPNHNKPILHDTQTEMYFPFQNCVVLVTENSVSQMEYPQLKDLCIWKDHIIKRSFTIVADYENAKFAKFIGNVSSNEPDRLLAFHSAIGYLLHNHSDPTTARAVIAYDEQIAGKREPAGGTGKGLLNQGICQLRNTAIIDGKKIKDDNQFSYQMVDERTQIISFDDVKPDFDFLMLNSNLTTGWQIEQKRKHPFRFPADENPKTYITCNTILKAEGTTATRRQFVIEFSTFYSKLVQQNKEPIIETHGGMFFTNNWNQHEWNAFFTFMMNCGKYYLQNGLKFYKLRSVAENKLLQATSDDFSEWIIKQSIMPGQDYNISEFFADFKAIYYGDDSQFKQRAFTNWLKIFSNNNGWKLECRQSHGISFGVFIAKTL